MGKYDVILPGLPIEPMTDPDDLKKQEKIDLEKATVTNRDPVLLAQTYIRLRAEKELLALKLSALNVKVEAYEQLLTASENAKEPAWGRYGAKPNALRLPSGDTIRIQPEPYGKVIDREAFRLWCIKNGYERQLQLWPSTMSLLVKERLVVGQPEPDGTEGFRYFKVILTRKGEPEE